MTELDYARRKTAWTKIPSRGALRRGWKVIKTRSPDDERLFAGTPPLEPLRLLLSDVATIGNAKTRKALTSNDVSRAFFEVLLQGNYFVVEAPEENMSEDDINFNQSL